MKTSNEQIKNAQNKGHYEGFLVEYLYRPISFFFTKVLVWTPATPNQVSYLALISALISAYFFALSGIRNDILGILFMHLVFVFDCSDGEIARLKNMKSDFGFWLDGIAVKSGEIAIYFGLTFGLILKSDSSNLFPLLNNKTNILILLSILLASRLTAINANETLFLLPKEKHAKTIKAPQIFTSGFLKKIARLDIISYNVQSFFLLITIGVLLNKVILVFLLLIVLNILALLIIATRLYKK